ncbi:hypothetical protein, partial [Crocosphaera chwakensis]
MSNPLSNYPSRRTIFFDFLALVAFLFFGLDAIIFLTHAQLPILAIIARFSLGYPLTHTLLSIQFYLLLVILIFTILISWSLIVKQLVLGWQGTSLVKKVMPYGQLRLLFLSIFIGLIIFFYLNAVTPFMFLWVVYLTLSLFLAIPFAL